MSSDSKVRIDLGDITPHNIKLLKKVNQVVFPVVYHDSFYKDVLEAGELAKLAYCNDIVVGAVCCRIDNSDSTRKLYIMTLGCLAPYRRLGIGTKMVEHVLNVVCKDGNYDSVFLHVQVQLVTSEKCVEVHFFLRHLVIPEMQGVVVMQVFPHSISKKSEDSTLNLYDSIPWILW